ncbi:Eco57I restriction-modification methylase domain-containing protein [Candidatus Saccharibacteria bacterium]|nr:Eco57I restriction-modification methylase domain-containing protein [Candidatus Saccharibacteria bacterium]
MPTNVSKNLLNLSHYYKNRRNPDILDCIANLSSDEVFTPPELADKVLDLLPEEVWSNPNLKWLDPACKTGVFLRQIAIRLMVGLKDAIPDEAERREHIFKKMLYGMPITRLTALMSRRSVYYAKNAMSDKSVVKFNDNEGNIIFVPMEHHFKMGKCTFCGLSQNEKVLGSRDGMGELENHAYQFIHLKEETLKTMKFDVIVGNPPYQLGDGGNGASATPIYHLFIQQAKRLNPRYMAFIVPSRWFAGGKGLDIFRNEMLNDRRIKKLIDYPDASDCFPGVSIEGGVNYFIWDREYDGDCEIMTIVGDEEYPSMKRPLNEYDSFIRWNGAISVLRKVQSRNEETIDKKISSRKPFGLATNFSDYNEINNPDKFKIYANKKIGYVFKSLIPNNVGWASKYKVLVANAYGGGGAFPNNVISKPLLAEPNSVCTETYMVAGTFDTEQEARNLIAYIKTRFFRFMLLLRKSSQHIPKDVYSFIPDLPMDHKWTDEELYKRYDLSKDEIGFIEKMVKEME